MPSLIPGYEYDIFVSYRQKDNKYDGWVSEFVTNLRKELEATFKEDVSIYFDENLHDGLLETHDVHDSLRAKLNCLIFIPVISQTYCDPNSFAWTNEFLAFKKLAGDDKVGLKTRLMNGNVASRILPVKIHDLDAEDRSFLENGFGGMLSAIEFIYKEPGVNRPLRPRDERHENQNKTDYRNQVNKTANAIKAIISGLKNPLVIPVQEHESGDKESLSQKSVAVLPFVNMSSDPDQEYFSDGISEEILNVLALVSGLSVPARTSSFYFKGKNQDIREIGRALNVDYLVQGSVRKSGNRIRIAVQIIEVSTGYHLWSDRFDRTQEDIFLIQDEIAQSIVNILKVKLRVGEAIPSFQKGQNIEAHNYVLKAMFCSNKGNPALIRQAIDYYTKATDIDVNYAAAFANLANTLIKLAFYGSEPYADLFARAEREAEHAVRLNPVEPNGVLALARITFVYKWDFEKSDQLFQKALSLSSNNVESLLWYGDYLKNMGRFEEGRILLEKATVLDPLSTWAHLFLSHAFFNQGNDQEYRREVETILFLEPDFVPVFYDLTTVYAQQHRMDVAADNFLKMLRVKFPPIYAQAMDALAAEGRASMLEGILSELVAIRKNNFLGALEEFFIYIIMQDFEKAIDCCYQSVLEKSIWVPYFKFHIFFQFPEIQEHPGFKKLLTSLNFPVTNDT